MKILVAVGFLCVFGLGAAAQCWTPRSVGDQFLTFVQSAAELLGEGLVRLLNLILPRDRAVGSELVQPLGYLGLITAILLLFGILEAARKVIWIIVGVGWALLLVRIVLDALKVR